MSRGNDVNDWYTPEQIERLKQGFPRENSVRLTKEEAAALLCRAAGTDCKNCILRYKVADVADCHEEYMNAKAKLKAYIEQP